MLEEQQEGVTARFAELVPRDSSVGKSTRARVLDDFNAILGDTAAAAADTLQDPTRWVTAPTMLLDCL